MSSCAPASNDHAKVGIVPEVPMYLVMSIIYVVFSGLSGMRITSYFMIRCRYLPAAWGYASTTLRKMRSDFEDRRVI